MSERIYDSSYYNQGHDQYDSTTRSQQQTEDQERMTAALLALIFSVGISAVIALLIAQRQEKKKTPLEKFAHQAGQLVEDGRETSVKAIETIQKDLDKLRKDVEKRIRA